MKLHHFVSDEARKLQDLGKALTQPQVLNVTEARKKSSKPQQEETGEGMDAAIHTMTQDQKHLHKKIAHHD